MATFTQKKVKKPNKARVDFRELDFRRLIEQKGMRLQWEQSIRCPCELILTNGGIEQPSGQFNIDCEACYGRGVIYHSPLEITGFFEDATKNPKRFEIYGEMAHGMAGITTLPEHTLNFMDRITLLDNRMAYNEMRTRRKTVERLRWPIIPRTFIIGDEFDNTESAEITTSVIYARKASIDGTISPTILSEGVDFVVENGQIDWSKGDELGTAPSVGEKYSLQYEGRPTYIVFDFPFTFRDTWVKTKNPSAVFREMPRRAVCKLEYLGPPEWPVHGITTIGTNG